MDQQKVRATPTKSKERIHALDLLRGFAILGILIMNIVSFSDIGTGYINPQVGGGLEGYNAWFHGFGHLFADMRFMSLFSMLFGAGILLFSENIQKKGLKAWKYQYRRMFWLLVFGMIHAYLIWMGDILVAYAICGSIVFLFRNWSNRTLWILSGVFFIIPVLFSLSTYFFTPQEMLQEIFAFYTPTAEAMATEIAAYRGSWLDQMEPRVSGAIELQTFLFLMEQMWRVLALMIWGMLLYRTGVILGKKDKTYYKKLAGYGLFIGLVISAVGLFRSWSHDWDGVWVMNVGHHYNYIASVPMALGYIGLINWWNQTDWWQSMQLRLRAVGRLAFTTYILSSVICTFIFYGHGLGLFATMDRLGQYGVILLVWMILLAISPPILRRYKQGPLEKLWRKLTYGWR